MAYSVVTPFVSLEQPTLAKWNTILSNQVEFNLQTGANFSTTGRIWWEELGRTTLGSAGDTISITSIAARKYLKLLWATQATGGTIYGRITFNGDTGTNYAFQSSSAFGAAVNSVSQANIQPDPAASISQRTGEAFITNISSQRKLIGSRCVDDNNASATTSCNFFDLYGKWDNVSAQITTITMTNTGTGDFAIGSTMIVLGHD